MGSILTKNQVKELKKEISYYGKTATITAEIRYDDRCGNGHNSFSITGDITIKGRRDSEECGCIHDKIAKHFPEIEHLIKWHHMTSEGPMHYVANSLYHASDKDCWGLRKGETRQIVNGKTKEPCWKLMAVDASGEMIDVYRLKTLVDSKEQPECHYTLKYVPSLKVGEGKEPDLNAARTCAIWPEAELKDFTEENLKARLPGLIAEFKKDIESIGFTF